MYLRAKVFVLAACVAGIARADTSGLSVIGCVEQVNVSTHLPGAYGCAPTSGQVAGPFNYTLGSQSGTVQATANYGQLGVAASVNVTSVTPEIFFSFAIADAFDELTINAPGLTGSQGFLNVYYTLNGNISSSGAVNPFVQVAFEAGNSQNGSSTFSSAVYTSSTSGLFEDSSPLPFTFGTPFIFSMCLGANNGVGLVPALLQNANHFATDLCSGGYTNPASATGAGTIDFLDTLSLSSLQVNDSLGNPVNGATLVSASGTQYALAPEPGPGLTAALGLGMIAAYWKRALRR